MFARRGASVGDPALVRLVTPVGSEVVDRLFEAVGSGVDVGLVAGAAERDVGELSAAAGGEDVGAVDGGALGSVDGEGVAVVEVVGVEAVAGDAHRASVAGARVEVAVVDGGDGESFAGDDPSGQVGGEGDELVADGVPASGCDLDVVAVEVFRVGPSGGGRVG